MSINARHITDLEEQNPIESKTILLYNNNKENDIYREEMLDV